MPNTSGPVLRSGSHTSPMTATRPGLPPTTQLAELLAAGATREALALCERLAGRGSGATYYSFWRDRLRSRLAGRAAATASAQALPQTQQKLRDELIAAVARHPYHLAPDGPEIDPAALPAALVEAMTRSPFKAEIYRPTPKVALADQVRGLHRVSQLVQPVNLEASAARFDALRRLVRERGARRVFVIGNGPSLKKTDLKLLRDEITIGFNGIFLHEHFTPTIYIVEDHLVAEDRAREIHAYRCPVKLFPSYLGYCIEAQDNTIYLNHRPRISYPVDTDFSWDAGHLTYTGGTVTYTGLQVAASLGVEEIILVGVDASYQVHNVERSDSYGTGVLTSREDDTNHFDPRYFGKGYRWHDPNVHTMLQAYRKAAHHAREAGLRIVNATLGGELEVFPRVDFHGLFARAKVYPRLSVLDFTSIDRLSATGILKRNLLQGWPKASQLHVHADEKARLIAYQHLPHDLYAPGSDDHSVWPALRSLIEHDPEVLYLRPTLDRVPMTVLQVVAASVLGRPWLAHYMDDWLLKAQRVRSAEVAAAYHEVMAWAFGEAAEVLSICPKMSRHLVQTFGLDAARVHAIHNMLPSTRPLAARGQGQDRVIRYVGGLEPDMGLSTVLEVARQVDEYNAAGPVLPLRFEVVASPSAINRHGPAFAPFVSTTLRPQFAQHDDYMAALAGSDLNLLCYNFDAASLAYVRYSLANKLPDLLASGRPFLAIGHPEIGTLELLREVGYPLLLDQPGFRIEPALQEAFGPDDAQLQRRKAAELALEREFADDHNRGRFHGLLRAAAQAPAAVSPAMPPLAALRTLLRSAPAQAQQCQDVDLLPALAMLPRDVIDPALALVRSHGRAWSVRDEFGRLNAWLAQSHSLPLADASTQARALACLVCGMGHERYDAVNQPVRAWLRGIDGAR